MKPAIGNEKADEQVIDELRKSDELRRAAICDINLRAANLRELLRVLSEEQKPGSMKLALEALAGQADKIVATSGPVCASRLTV